MRALVAAMRRGGAPDETVPRPQGRIAPHHRVMAAVYHAPRDPSIFADAGVDAGALLRFQEEMAGSGQRTTVTAIVAKAAARALVNVPEANVVWRRGRWHARRSVRLWIYATDEEGRVAGRPILDADSLPIHRVQELLDRMNRRMGTPRGRKTYRAAHLLHGAPLRLATRLVGSWLHTFGLGGRKGLDNEGFGAIGITNVGSIGVRLAPAVAIPPISRHTVLLAVGQVHDVPVAQGQQVVVRPWLSLTATLDHRAIVGWYAKRLLDAFQEGLTDAAVLRSYVDGR